ncbi:CRISPR-associated endonuclease Cas2 [Gluconobacter albidus]|uniref:Uncharacterized protein n=1 Tax=Gluconobacter albidus TaxID=318683 RepID=A0ABQ5X0N6_9PROT|nr:hypothetical protein AA3250_2170 [Gluconobacter albidus NBRC 3250]GLQ69360.1 hypothetical protein GCM10007866_18110 [Gluconobacter albidus]
MTSWIVSYDLRNAEGSQDYQPLWDYLKAHGAHRVQKSLWFLASPLSAKDLTKMLQSLIHPKDRILVAELVTNSWWVNAMPGTNDWVKANPPSR